MRPAEVSAEALLLLLYLCCGAAVERCPETLATASVTCRQSGEADE
jgi:hypothetical protein